MSEVLRLPRKMMTEISKNTAPVTKSATHLVKKTTQTVATSKSQQNPNTL